MSAKRSAVAAFVVVVVVAVVVVVVAVISASIVPSNSFNILEFLYFVLFL